MPEGDTIHYAAHRMRPVLEGRVPDEIAHAAPALRRRPLARAAGRPRGRGRRRPRQAPLPALRGRPRHPLAPAHDRRVGRLSRRASAGGARRGARGSSCAPRGHEVVQFDGPVLELMTASRARFDQRLAGAGPRHPRARARRATRFLRAPARGRPDAADRRRAARPAHDRRASATCGSARAASTPASTRGGRRATVSDDEALRVVRLTRPRMQQSARDGFQDARSGDLRPRRPAVPALRRADPRARAGRRQPPDILVPGMPALKRIGHKGADLIAPGNTLARFDAALAAGVDMVEFDVLPEHPDGRGRLVLAHDFAAAARGDAAHARGGPRPLRPGRVGGRRARRRPQATGLRAARHRRAARARAGRARAHLDDGGARACASSARTRRSIRLGWSVPQAAAQLPGQPVHALAGAARPPQYARTVLPAPRRARASASGRVDALMSHWALVTPRLVARGRAAPAASSTCGRSTTRRGSPSSSASASPASSRTTRGCSLPRDLARRARHAPLTVRAVAVPGRRVQARAVDDLRPSRHSTSTRPRRTMREPGSGSGKVNVVPPCTEPRADADARQAGVAARAHEAPGALACRRTTAGGCAPTAAARPARAGSTRARRRRPAWPAESQRLTVAHRPGCDGRGHRAAGASARAGRARGRWTRRACSWTVHGGGGHPVK